MSSLRSLDRNVHFKFEGDEEPFGGMEILSANTITNRQLLRFLEVLVIPDDKVSEPCAEGSVYRVFLEQDEVVANDNPMSTGTYLVVPRLRGSELVTLHVTDEDIIRRALSHSITGRTSKFGEAVRQRDEGCAISGAMNRRENRGLWTGFEAAHVFPLGHSSESGNVGVGRWITEGESLTQKLNSAQNGMMLSREIHSLFDQYFIGIDVDDGYKVVIFADCSDSIANCNGRTMAEWARQNGEVGVRDELLRWHLRMCVLANMKGSGEPVWDYEDDDDIAGAILSQDPSGEQFALEIGSRLERQGYHSSQLHHPKL